MFNLNYHPSPKTSSQFFSFFSLAVTQYLRTNYQFVDFKKKKVFFFPFSLSFLYIKKTYKNEKKIFLILLNATKAMTNF